jgi:hypothetical protein
MSGPSSEQVAYQIYRDLPPHDRRLVRQWVDRTGADWATSLINAGVLGTRYRRTPEEEARAAARREADEALEAWEHLIAPADEVTRRREAAEHEASHAIVAQAFGSNVSVTSIGTDGSGLCRYRLEGLDDLQRATIMLAPGVWINTIRGDRFPRGASGTSQDQRDAIRTGADLQAATR